MANGVLGWVNIFDAGGITTDSESPVAPVSNLASPQGGYPWMSAYGTTTASIYLDAAPAINGLESGSLWVDAEELWSGSGFLWGGDRVNWRAFGIFRSNLSASATIQYKLGTTLGGSDVLDTGLLSGVHPGRNQHVYVHPSVLVAQYLTISISDPSNQDQQLKVGMAFGGNVLEPTINFDFNTARGREHRTDISVSSGGFEYPKHMWSRRRWDVSWSDLSDEEVKNDLDQVDKFARMGYNVMFVPDYEDDPSYGTVFGMVKEPSAFSFAQQGFNRYGWNAEITERL